MTTIPPNLKIGFIADTGLRPRSFAVLQLLKKAGVDAIVHSGDFDYQDDAEAMEQYIASAFGEDFPFIVAIGNHDEIAWEDYRTMFHNRLLEARGLYCEGLLGVKSYCVFRGIQIVSTGSGTLCDYHEDYATAKLAQTPFRSATNCAECGDGDGGDWKVLHFHKVVTDFQLSVSCFRLSQLLF